MENKEEIPTDPEECSKLVKRLILEKANAEKLKQISEEESWFDKYARMLDDEHYRFMNE
jgi:hypothetical protein